MGLRSLAGALTGRRLPAGAIATAGVLGLAVLLVLDVLSAQQVQTWRDERAMWQQCLKVDPNSARAHGGLADQLANAGRFDEAIGHYRAVVRLAPDNPEMLDIVALQLASFQDVRFREYDEAIRLARRACELSEWEDPRYTRGLATVYTLFAHSLANRSDFVTSIENYENAVKADPEFVPALRSLAVLLATCPQQELRDDDLAIRLAERACELTERADPALIMVVAEIHAQAGRREMAIAATEEAIALAEAAADVELADQLRRRLQLFRSGAPPQSGRP
jgi:tetratricopeptide (TPR) repeat protein